MPSASLPQLQSLGKALDMDSFGILRPSVDLLDDSAALRQRMAEDGYLYLPGLLRREEVLEARRYLSSGLAEAGVLAPGTPSMDSVAKPGLEMRRFKSDLSGRYDPLDQVLYQGPMMDFFARFLGGEVLHYDHTWIRAVAPGRGTNPHCDIVYMGRGTDRVYTAWVPMGDVDFKQGGLMILEKSNQSTRLRSVYCKRDVDTFCSNKPGADQYASGEKWWNGWLSHDPVTLRQQPELGGRWLSAEYQAGDALIFSMYTVHASLDNRSDRIRLSTDTRYQLASEPVDERWVGKTIIAHGAAGKRGRIC